MNADKKMLEHLIFITILRSKPIPSQILHVRNRYNHEMPIFLLMIYIITIEMERVCTYTSIKTFYRGVVGWRRAKFCEVQDTLIKSGLLSKTSRVGRYYLTEAGKQLGRELYIELRKGVREQMKAFGID